MSKGERLAVMAGLLEVRTQAVQTELKEPSNESLDRLQAKVSELATLINDLRIEQSTHLPEGSVDRVRQSLKKLFTQVYAWRK